MIDKTDRLVALALSFPTLSDAPLIPWKPEKLDAWACGPVPGAGAFEAARFVLSIWNDSVQWKCGRFDLQKALGCWDSGHRKAFNSWANDPWWP